MRTSLIIIASLALAACSSGGSGSSSTGGSTAASTGTHGTSGSGGASTSTTGGTSGSTSSSTSSTGSTSGSSSSTGGSSTGSTLTAAQACDQSASAFCDYAARCQIFDPATTDCAALTAEYVCPPSTLADAQAGQLAVSPGAGPAIAALAAYLGDAGCDGVTGQEVQNNEYGLGSFASALFIGAVPLGGACNGNGECAALSDAGYVYCSGSFNGCSGPGICTAESTAGIGESCASVSCNSGFCDDVDIPDGGAVCEPLRGLDGGCTGYECDPTVGYCDLNTDRCAAYLGSGATCVNGLCDPSLTCLSTTSTCGSALGESAPCTTYSDCAPPLDCLAVADGGEQCELHTADGGACSLTNLNCDASENCFGGICSPYDATLGDTCGQDATGERYCDLGVCDNPDGGPGHCVAYSGLGEACTADGSAPGICLTNYGCDAGHCAAVTTAGNSCTSLYDCRQYETCVNGLCAPQFGPGSTCDPTLLNTCYEAFCDPTSHTCQPQGLDAPCGLPTADATNNGGCEPDLSCTLVGDGGSTCQLFCDLPELARRR